MKIYITTNGCEVGQLYSMHIQQFFLRNNLNSTVTKDPKEADLIVLYGCGLTESQERKSLFIFNQLKHQMKPSARLVVWGCISKQNPKALAGNYGGPVIGPSDLNVFEEIFKEAAGHPCNNPINIMDANIPLSPSAESFKLRNLLVRPNERLRQFNVVNDYILPTAYSLADKLLYRERVAPVFYIRVAEGCLSYCTYCSERLVWGTVKSRSIEKVISEFKLGLKEGYTRFYLCAEDLGAYGVDLGYTANELLSRMVNIDKGKEYKIIINEMSPPFLKNNFSNFKKILESGRIESLGCQVETGSNRILKLMGRKYCVEDWINHMICINKTFPDINLTTHFMVGFPTETDEDFEATLSLLDYPLSFKQIAIFKFSPSWRVPASRLSGQVAEKVKEQRFRKLQSKFLRMYLLNSSINMGRKAIKRIIK
jgi:tRNA A37 methylthiotransferase MiaB